MPQILVRDIDAKVIAMLKAQARRRHRSLQGELKQILEQAAREYKPDIRAAVDAIRKQLSTRAHTDSAKQVRADRNR